MVRSVSESVMRPVAVSINTMRTRRRLVLGVQSPRLTLVATTNRISSAAVRRERPEVDRLGAGPSAWRAYRSCPGFGPAGEVGGLASAKPLEVVRVAQPGGRGGVAAGAAQPVPLAVAVIDRAWIGGLPAAITDHVDDLPGRLAPRAIGHP